MQFLYIKSKISNIKRYQDHMDLQFLIHFCIIEK